MVVIAQCCIVTMGTNRNISLHRTSAVTIFSNYHLEKPRVRAALGLPRLINESIMKPLQVAFDSCSLSQGKFVS